MSDARATQEAESPDEVSIPSGALRPPQLPGGSPVLGHLRELASDNLALFARCAALNGIVQFSVHWYRCHVITAPALVGELLVGQASAFRKTRALQIARPTFGNGLVTSEGETWRRQQRLLRGFLTPQAAAGYGESVQRAITRKLDTWQSSGPIDLHSEMIDVSLDIVCHALFGLDASRVQPFIRSASQAVQRWHTDCQALCLPYPHYLPTRSNLRYRTRSLALDRAVFALIREARATPRSMDAHGLLGALVRLSDEQGGIGDREIRDHVVTLFLAGHDTTASSLAFALYELSYRPDLQARIADESGDGGQSDALEQVIKETLRLYPAVHLVARTALRDVMLGPYLVRRGEEVVVPLYVMHRLPSLFPRPDAFEPERWAHAGRERVCPRHAHVPFSVGPRVCTGQAMAMAELRQVIPAVLRRFQLESIAPRAPRIDAQLTLSPAAQSTRVAVIPLRHGCSESSGSM